MEKALLRKITSLGILIVLIVLSFILLKPVLMSIIWGIILAFLFVPLYKKINKKIKNKNIAAGIVCALLIILIIVPIWFLTPSLLNESIDIYLASQQIDLVTPMKNLFPSLFQNEVFSEEMSSILYSFVTKITNGAMNIISNTLINFPTLFLQLLVVLFTFYFVMRDNEEAVNYLKSLLPFSKNVEEKLFRSTKDLTYSILYGEVVIGILQGIFAGISFFLFGVDKALFLTVIACIAGIFPMISTTIVWIPVAIYLFINSQIGPALGVTLFGCIGYILENIVKPMFISKRTNVHSGIILLGMVGGLFVFGALGIILGPLILSYLLIVLEIYRDKKTPGYLIQDPEEEELDIKMGDF